MVTEVLVQENQSLKKALEVLMNETEVKETFSDAGEVVEYDGKQYQLLLAKMNIPKLGVLTALEVAASPEAIAYLINKKSSAIKELA